jgi:hypothetical protein
MTDDPPAATPGPVVPGPPRGMLASGARLGAAAWWCDQVFAVAGAWVPTTDEASVRVHLAELSRVVGEHGLALRCHLPRPSGVEPEAWVVAPSPGASALVSALEDADGALTRLAGLHRAVVPRLLVRWRIDARAAGVADRGVARTLGHAHTDVLELWHEGVGLLDVLEAADADGARTALTWAGALEVDLATGGGVIPEAPTTPPM